MSVPPGWYPDPDVPGGSRWHDGTGWTDHRTGVGQAGFAPPSPAAGYPLPAERRPGMNPTARVFLVLGAVVGGFVLLSIVAAVAVPLLVNRTGTGVRAQLGAVDCARVAEDTIALSQEGPLAREDGHHLLDVTDLRLVNDQRATVTAPTPGSEQYVMTCTGLGYWDDGHEAPVYMYVFLADDLTLLHELRYD